jgi:hypothetical protein
MILLQIANIISLLPSLGLLYIAAIGVLQANPFYLLHAILTVLVAKSTDFIKFICKGYMTDYPWLKRPDGACDCDLSNGGGNVGDRCGFPSGHSAITAFLVIPYWFRGDISTAAAAVALGAMGWARWVKQCHNLTQIGAGLAWGGAIGWLFARLNERFKYIYT